MNCSAYECMLNGFDMMRDKKKIQKDYISKLTNMATTKHKFC